MANWIRIKNAGHGYTVGPDTYYADTKTGDTVDINLDLCSNIIHSNDYAYIFQNDRLIVSCTEAEYCDALMDGSCNDGRPQCKPPKIVEDAATR